MKHTEVHPGSEVKNMISITDGIVYEIDDEKKRVIIIAPKDVWKDRDVHKRWLMFHKSDMTYAVSFDKFNTDFLIKKPFSQQDMDMLPKELGQIKHGGHLSIPFRQTKQWPDPEPGVIDSPTFRVIWDVIKHWDISVPGAYPGRCSATGNHVRAIMDGLASIIVEMSENGSDGLRRAE